MQPRCSICWTVQNLAKCSKEDCPHLLCTLHGNRYGGHCIECWETAEHIAAARRQPQTEQAMRRHF